MNKTIVVAAAAIVFASPAFAGTTANSMAQTQAQSSSANMGVNAVVNSYGAAIPDRTTSWIFNNPATVTPSSTFGWSPENCGGSDSKTYSTLIGSYGESKAKEMLECNDRADSKMAWQMGMRQVAILRLWCFGSDSNRMAYEASGHVCPSSATAKGIPGAPVGPKFAVAQIMPKTMHGTINADGSVTWKH